MQKTMYKRISVIGAGAWGTTLAHILSDHVDSVDLWCHEEHVVQDIQNKHINTLYLNDIILNDNVYPTSDLHQATSQSDIIFWVTPFIFIASLAARIKNLSSKQVVIASKGIDVNLGHLAHEIIKPFCPTSHIAIFSGGSFARDVACHKPALITMACSHKTLYNTIESILKPSCLSLEYTDDMIGVALGGALKNALSIACGLVHGLQLGDSARAAVLMKGLAEIRLYFKERKAKKDTLFTSSCLGDLLMTATSLQSRNTQLGVSLAQGHTLKNILSHNKTVAEGVNVVFFLAKIATTHNIPMPIFQTLADICHGDIPFHQAIKAFLQASDLHTHFKTP